jgi:hypothetical protein
MVCRKAHRGAERGTKCVQVLTLHALFIILAPYVQVSEADQ